MHIKFLGAAMSVTGSCHLITTDKYKILLDCGQFQGSKALEELNYDDFDFDPIEIDFMILSHSHIDHSGRIPLLTKRGYTGKIYCTDATADLVSIMLKDSGYIHEKEAEWTNRKAERSGGPMVEPLYTFQDAEDSEKYLEPVLYGQLLEINPDIHLRFKDAGHILGSSIVELWIKEGDKITKIVYSGDLGVSHKPILRDPELISEADYLIMETTYGDRIHEPSSKSVEKLIDVILKTTRRGGTVVIPSFAVGRTQELIYELNIYYEYHKEYREELDKIMVYVDSPLATSATEIFQRNSQVFDDETREYILKGDNPLDFKNLKFTRTTEESKQLNFDSSPKIIISASGMCDAGRIKHHLKHNLWNSKNSIVFVGYQAEGTLGRSIVDGDKDVSIFGEKIHINAEIYYLDGFSGHADRDDLLAWLSAFQNPPKRIFLVHGEEESKDGFAAMVKHTLRYECTVIKDVSEFSLDEDVMIGVKDIRNRVASEEQLIKVRNHLSKIHDEIETIIYNSQLAVNTGITQEAVNEINNIILEIEKGSIRLGTAVSNRKE
ncbi:MAG: MBL fold metallo-hydrolase [Eubacteriales bacterium]|nr:MBL fold metallo-hydrolase [Eubacteriales bacterium]MDD3199015.1 MBL fold metallo-hydrolase [Eubacteriales bacterium]MDD4121831.1 MBL fold metallo-hydrolase [Eubacteriales bacterium]MDD4629499.1 MBL fold metallo-hydrolase [Eubacteriales bacterium]